MNSSSLKIKLGKIGKVSMCKRILKHQTSPNGEIPFYKISSFGGQAETFISKELYDEFREKYSFPKKGDILISAAGTLGKTVIYDGKPAYFQDSNIVWIDNDESIVLNSFLYYFYQTKPWVTTNGSTINRIYNDNLRNIKLTVPDLPTQKAIAKVLSGLDAKIELNNKINRELESMAKTLYDYWFVQFDFPDANGKPYKSSGGKMVYNAELKREIPEGWEVKKLGDIIKKYADKSTHIESKNILNEGSYPVITQDNGDLISGFTNENNPIEDVPLIVFGDHSCTLRYIDFPFFRGADGTQIMYFEEDLTIYVYLFLQMIITQIPGYGKYERHYKYLKEFNIIIPKAKFLSEFQKIVEPIFNKISKSRLQNQHLTTLRDWLLPMLMNGQVTVKEAEERLRMAAEPSAEYKKG